MAQPFRPWVNAVARWGPPLVVLGGMLVATVGALAVKSNFNTGVGVPIEQPVPFSHKHHVEGAGLDCRFCHTSVARSDFAGLPDTKTCMTCHSQIWPTSPVLAPIRKSWEERKPMQWNRVLHLPDHVYFSHQAHVNHGVGCVTCHGRMSEMPLTAKVHPFFMAECVNCHQNPDPNLRPMAEIFNEDWKALDQSKLGAQLHRDYGIDSNRIQQCSVCHR